MQTTLKKLAAMFEIPQTVKQHNESSQFKK